MVGRQQELTNIAVREHIFLGRLQFGRVVRTSTLPIGSFQDGGRIRGPGILWSVDWSS